MPDSKLKVLFVCSGNSREFKITPFIESQGLSLKKKGIMVEFYSVKGKGLKGYLKNIAPLRRYIQKNDYDIIHAHYALCGWVARLTFTKKPIVVSYMGSDTLGDLDKNGKRMLKSYVEIFAAKFLQPFVDKIIVKSKNLAKHIYRKEICAIIPNGVDFERFVGQPERDFRAELKLDKSKRYILFLGRRNNFLKNYRLAHEAVSMINDPDLELLNPYPVAHKEIPLYLNASDVLVLASYQEGSPNVIKEAMACNLPIVSTNVGDVREVISQTDGCFLADFDAEDFAEKIKLALRFKKPTQGREHIRHLDEKHIADRLIKLYRELYARSS